MLLSHARSVLSRLRCNGHSLLLSFYFSKIGRIENPFCSACGTRPWKPLISFCTVQLWTLCVARSLAIFSLQPLDQALGTFPVSGASWSSAINPYLGRGRVTTTTAKLKLPKHYYVKRELANLYFPKIVNRITSQSATCYHKIPSLFI